MTKHLIEPLVGSKIYQDYKRAFSEMTGLPMMLRPVESWQLPHHDEKFENPFCAMLAGKSRSCAACLQTQQQLSETATHVAKTVTCQAGLCDTRRAGADGRPVDRLSLDRPGVLQKANGRTI